MIPLLRKIGWWLQRRRKEDELREELAFHLSEEASQREADGLPGGEAMRAARRELGNATLLKEDARTLWSWTLLEQLAQDVRYGVRGMVKHRMFTALAALSLALGIGAKLTKTIAPAPHRLRSSVSATASAASARPPARSDNRW
jgi:hypothetical protein